MSKTITSALRQLIRENGGSANRATDIKNAINQIDGVGTGANVSDLTYADQGKVLMVQPKKHYIEVIPEQTFSAADMKSPTYKDVEIDLETAQKVIHLLTESAEYIDYALICTLSTSQRGGPLQAEQVYLIPTQIDSERSIILFSDAEGGYNYSNLAVLLGKDPLTTRAVARLNFDPNDPLPSRVDSITISAKLVYETPDELELGIDRQRILLGFFGDSAFLAPELNDDQSRVVLISDIDYWNEHNIPIEGYYYKGGLFRYRLVPTDYGPNAFVAYTNPEIVIYFDNNDGKWKLHDGSEEA